MDPVIIAAGFAVYFLLVVFSYMLLSNPEINELWGGLLLASSLLAALIPVYYALGVLLRGAISRREQPGAER